MTKQYVNQDHINEVYTSLKKHDKKLIYPQKDFTNSHSIKGLIDLNEILECFPALKLKKDYVLDYVYEEYGQGLVPYVRKKDDKYFRDMHELYQAEDYECFEWLKYIECLDNPEGYFDLAVFFSYLHNIYLFDHANYNHIQMLYAKQQIDYFWKHNGVEENDIYPPYEDEEVNKLKDIDSRPFVEKDQDGNTIVSFLIESPWGGVFWARTVIDLTNQTIERKDVDESDVVIEHDCGICF
jgi:hypothetical protein